MNVAAFHCKAGKKGQMTTLIDVVSEEEEKEGISSEFVQSGKERMNGQVHKFCLIISLLAILLLASSQESYGFRFGDGGEWHPAAEN